MRSSVVLLAIGATQTQLVLGQGIFSSIGKSLGGLFGRNRAAPTVNIACCNDLATALADKVTTSADGKEYTDELSSYWAAQLQEQKAGCFVHPTSSADVSAAIKIINTANKAKDNSCPFAVRSGGHTPNAGWANIANGVTINLAKLNQVDVRADRKVVALGPGNRWGEVYDKLDAQNLAVTGGRASTVGVGGLTTGGGLSFFSPKYGLVCDNVANFEVVLASGDVVNANITSNPDLYKALKGGSSNFGIVTRIDMNSFEQGKFWGGTAFLSGNKRAQAFSFLDKVARSGEKSAHVIINYTWVSVLGAITIPVSTSQIEWTKEEENPPFFKPLVDNSISFNGRIDTHAAFAKEIDSFNPSGKRQLFLSFSFVSSSSFPETVYQLSEKYFKKTQKSISGLNWSISFQPIAHSTVEFGKATGGNSLGLDDSKDIIVVLLTATWGTTGQDSSVYKNGQAFWEEARDASKAQGLDSSFIYLNYGAFFQDPIAGYGPAAVSSLRAASAKYDSEGIFQKNVPGGFKIPKADGSSATNAAGPATAPETADTASAVTSAEQTAASANAAPIAPVAAPDPAPAAPAAPADAPVDTDITTNDVDDVSAVPAAPVSVVSSNSTASILSRRTRRARRVTP